MPFTSNSDIYAAIQDAGINRVVKHVMRQRPSLFNYGTALVAEDIHLLCSPIEADPRVLAADNPLVTVIDPLPVIGTSYAMNYAIQLTNGQIDFFPSNIIALPPDLNPPLPAQELAVHFGFCAGLGCPSYRTRRSYPGGFLGTQTTKMVSRRTMALPSVATSPLRGTGLGQRVPTGPINVGQTQLPPLTVLPTNELDCVCLDLYATAGCSIVGMVGSESIRPEVLGIDIPELAPPGIDKALECYALVALNDGILPTVGNSISTIAFGLINLPGGLGDIQVSASTSVPNNPAIQDDQMETFINVNKIDINLNLNLGGGGVGSSGGSGGSITRTTRNRTRSGTFDLTAAVSGATFEKIFGAFIRGFKFSSSGNTTFGPIYVGYDVAAHLESGSVQLNSNGSIEVKDVVVRWDTLKLTLGFSLPKVCTPSFCLIPVPFDGCLVDVPAECLFGGNPDFAVSIDLGGFIDSKVTFTGIPRVFYGVGSGVPNQWQIAVEPDLPILLDIVDIADTVGDLFNTLVTNSIDALISGLPGWAQDLVNAVLGGVDDIIRTVLGIPDDIVEWLGEIISNIGIWQDLIDALAQYISITIFELDDPLTILPAQNSLIPVQIPVQFIGISVDSSELVLQGDIGD